MSDVMTIGDIRRLIDSAFDVSSDLIEVIEALDKLAQNEALPPDLRVSLEEQANKLRARTVVLMDDASHTGTRLRMLKK